MTHTARVTAEMDERDALILETFAIDPSDADALNRVVETRRAAFAGAGDNDRASRAYLLAIALNLRYNRFADVAAMREAVPYLRAAVDNAAAADPFRARYVCELSVALSELVHLHQEMDRTLAAESVRLAARAVNLTPEGHPQHVARVAWHGTVLCRQGSATGSAAELNEGVSRLRQAVADAHPDDPRKANFLGMLAVGLVLRHRHAHSDSDLEEAHRTIELAAFTAHPFDPATGGFKPTWDLVQAHRRGGAR